MPGDVIHQPDISFLYKSGLYKENGAHARFRVQASQKQNEIWRKAEYLNTKTGLDSVSIVQARLVQRGRAYFLQLEDNREEDLNVDGFAVDVAGFPVGGGGNDADGFGVQFGAYALDDLDVPEFSVGADVELNQEASFDAGFCGGLRVTEFLRNLLGEIIDVATLEGGLVLGSRERNDLY